MQSKLNPVVRRLASVGRGRYRRRRRDVPFHLHIQLRLVPDTGRECSAPCVRSKCSRCVMMTKPFELIPWILRRLKCAVRRMASRHWAMLEQTNWNEASPIGSMYICIFPYIFPHSRFFFSFLFAKLKSGTRMRLRIYLFYFYCPFFMLFCSLFPIIIREAEEQSKNDEYA